MLLFSLLSSLPTYAFRHLGPVPTARALRYHIPEQHIGRQALVRPPGAVISGVPSDLLVINDSPKLRDWSQTALHSFVRRHTLTHEHTLACALIFTRKAEGLQTFALWSWVAPHSIE